MVDDGLYSIPKESVDQAAPQDAASQGLAPEAMKRLEAAKAAREQLAKELTDKMNALKPKAEEFKEASLKKYKKEIIGITILPPKPKEKNEFTDPELLVLLKIDEEDFEKLYRKKEEVIEKLKPACNTHLKGINVNYISLKELWDACEKAKYEVLNILTMGLPVYDTGWITAIKSVEYHKAQVIQKFEKYIVSYAISGSVLRGEARAESDLDTFVVIDDTDVTRMTDSELKSKLLSIIWGMAAQASMQFGGKYKIHTQVYLLTDMWNSINLAHPVIFTLIREGVPLYDRGMFMPWKLLLRKGMIKSTPESIRGFVKSGKQAIDRVKRKFREIATEDLFWAASIPAQGALMMEGKEPPVPWHTPEEFNKHFVKERKLMTAKDTEVLMKNLKMFKGFEHGEITDVDPKAVVENVEATEKFLDKIEIMFEKLQKEKVSQESKDLHDRMADDAGAALGLLGVKRSSSMHNDLKKHIVDKKLAPARLLDVLNAVEKANEEKNLSREELASLLFEEEKLATEMFDRIRSEKGGKLEKFKVSVSYDGGKKVAGVWLLKDDAYVIVDSNNPKTGFEHYSIGKDGSLSGKKSTSLAVIDKALKQFAGSSTTLTDAGLDSIKEIFGKDAKIMLGA